MCVKKKSNGDRHRHRFQSHPQTSSPAQWLNLTQALTSHMARVSSPPYTHTHPLHPTKAHVTRGPPNSQPWWSVSCLWGWRLALPPRWSARPPPSSGGKRDEEGKEWAKRIKKDLSSILAASGRRVLAHSDFPHGGFQALHGRIDVPLKGKRAFELEAGKEDWALESQGGGCHEEEGCSPLEGRWLFPPMTGYSSGLWPHLGTLF